MYLSNFLVLMCWVVFISCAGSVSKCSSYLYLQSTQRSHQSYVREDEAILSVRANADVIVRLQTDSTK